MRRLRVWLRRRRAGARRGDSELEQSVVRLVLGSVVVAYMVTSGSEGAAPATVATIRWVGGGFLAAALALFVAVALRFGPAALRRHLGILMDIAGTSVMMLSTGEAGAPLLGLYLWIIVGNGFRYGIRHLAVATALSLAGFALVAFNSTYWLTHPFFAVSYALVLLIIPAYVAALLTKLHRAVRAAEEASSAKSRFLARMSHELRTPLNGVIAASDLLLDAHLKGQEREFVRTIHASGRTLLAIIDNILDFAKIEAGRLSIEVAELDLHRLVSETVAMFEAQARRKGIALETSFDPDLPYQLRGDALHLRQVLMNLLGNAVKFTQTGGVELRVLRVPAAERGIRVRFEVQDTGIGIPAAEQVNVFERFQQAAATSGRYGGTGLGTAIARELVRLMGGEIGLRSAPGEGSLFWFELPLEPAPELAGRPDELANERLLLLGAGAQADALVAELAAMGLAADSESAVDRLTARLERAVADGRPYSVLLVCAAMADAAARARLPAGRGDGPPLLRFLLRDGSTDLATGASAFDASLDLPLRAGSLRNALHAARTRAPAGDKVVSLADHWRSLAPGPGLRVLVAEDNETNRRVLRALLERAGHSLVMVNDGEAALDTVATEGDTIDALVLDNNMPGRDGLAVFRMQRFMRPRSPIPTIILSADATDTALAAAREAGVDAYLTKPVDGRQFLTTLARVARVAGAGISPTAEGRGATLRSASGPTGSGVVLPEGEEPFLDPEKLASLRHLGETGSFFDELVTGFEQDVRGAAARLDEALEDSDYPAMRAALHAIRGSAVELGASRLAAAAQELRGLRPGELRSARAEALRGHLQGALSTTLELLRRS